MEDMLRIDKLLDFCDVPQLFVARDAFETLYLCLLYEDEPACRYTGIRISARLLDAFLTGKADLRQLFLQPENEREYYDVVFQSGEYRKTLSDEKTLPEDKLPTAGYVLPEDARENQSANERPQPAYGTCTQVRMGVHVIQHTACFTPPPTVLYSSSGC